MRRSQLGGRPIYEMPVTRMGPEADKPGVPRRPSGPLRRSPPSRPSLNLEHTMQWIATAGRPDYAEPLMQQWVLVNEALRRLQVRGNTKAVTGLPEGLTPVDCNGAHLSAWIQSATKEDLDVLHKLYAAMRLRIRHANWIKRKR